MLKLCHCWGTIVQRVELCGMGPQNRGTWGPSPSLSLCPPAPLLSTGGEGPGLRPPWDLRTLSFTGITAWRNFHSEPGDRNLTFVPLEFSDAPDSMASFCPTPGQPPCPAWSMQSRIRLEDIGQPGPPDWPEHPGAQKGVTVEPVFSLRTETTWTNRSLLSLLHIGVCVSV